MYYTINTESLRETNRKTTYFNIGIIPFDQLVIEKSQIPTVIQAFKNLCQHCDNLFPKQDAFDPELQYIQKAFTQHNPDYQGIQALYNSRSIWNIRETVDPNDLLNQGIKIIVKTRQQHGPALAFKPVVLVENQFYKKIHQTLLQTIIELPITIRLQMFIQFENQLEDNLNAPFTQLPKAIEAFSRFDMRSIDLYIQKLRNK